MAKKKQVLIEQPSIDKLLSAKVNPLTNTIYLQGAFGEEIEFADFDIMFSLLELTGDPIIIRLNSSGGDLITAFAISGRIKASPSTIIIEAYGQVSSAAILVLAIADVRRASKFTRFMHHTVSAEISGTLQSLDNSVKSIQADEIIRFGALADHTKRAATWWQEKSVPDYYFGSEEALDIGLIDEII